MDWKNYEETVKNIYAILGKNHGVKIECHGNDCKRTGKSGVSHQIDVLTSHSDGVHTYLTIIECKYWNDKINKDIVMKVSNIVEDCNCDRGIVVSRSGFTPDGIEFAKYKNVKLVKLAEISDINADSRIEEHHIFQLFFPTVLEMTIISESESGSFAASEDSVFVFPDGTAMSIKDCYKEFASECLKESGKEVVGERPFPKGTVFKGEKDVLVKGIRFKGVLREENKELVFKGDEYVSMVMNSFFENKDYIVLTNGEVHELRK